MCRMLPPALTEPAAEIAARLRARGQTVAVAESAAGGLVSAALLAVPGASAYFRGGVVIYTLDGARELLVGGPLAAGVRGASEPFARWLAASAAGKLAADWGIGETGAAGPSGNPYGDPAGHDWVAVHPPDGQTQARHVLTGSDNRPGNMESFAVAALVLLLEALS
jgi:nicotinamide-nucleotide amidase